VAAQGTIVRCTGLGKHYGTQDVLEDVTLSVEAGQKIGLVGRNGAGKTTLLRILLGEEPPSSGQCIRATGARIGYVPQGIDVPDGLAVESFLLQDHRRAEADLRAREAELALPAGASAAGLARYQAALDAFEAAGGHEAAARAERLLDGLGLGGRLQQPAGSLSGGERNVLALARALLDRPDLLVLDEPGNHLDYEGLAWLERYLAAFPGAVLLVSHDRHLLDAVATVILELEGRRLREYAGNYSSYRMQKLRALVAQQADYSADRKHLERLEALVARFAAIARSSSDPGWGRRLHARQTQLARQREQAVARPELDSSRIRLRLESRAARADIALRVVGYTRSVGGRKLFENASLEIACGERVALVGPNGCGKTTFIRDLVESGSWDHPHLRVGPSLTIGYCAQNQETLDPARTVLETLLALGVPSRQAAFPIAARVLFDWDDLDKRVAELSGGEANRLQLACLTVVGATLLLLDEPTNHVDVASREAIEESLAEFPGTVLVVSHDRYFLDKIATAVVEVRDRGFGRYAGQPLEFWQERDGAASAPRRRPPAASAPARLATRGRERRRPPGPAPAGAIEGRIERLERERAEVERKLSEAFARGEHRQGRDLANRAERLQKLIDALYEDWQRASG
jgi:ATP-binding cassette subfamily F protein 3